MLVTYKELAKRAVSLDRRQFPKSGMRYVLFTGLGALAVAGEAKQRRLENDPNCVRVWASAECVEFGGCTKRKAQDYRHAKPQASEPPRQPADQAHCLLAHKSGIACHWLENVVSLAYMELGGKGKGNGEKRAAAQTGGEGN